MLYSEYFCLLAHHLCVMMTLGQWLGQEEGLDCQVWNRYHCVTHTLCIVGCQFWTIFPFHVVWGKLKLHFLGDAGDSAKEARHTAQESRYSASRHVKPINYAVSHLAE